MNLLQNSEYKHWLKDLKQKVMLIEFYWELGEEIVLRQSQASWGDGFLKQLSQDLMAEFLEMKGFSKRNLEQIHKWYQFWSTASAITQQPVSQLVQIPWGHNLKIIAKCQSIAEVDYYVQNTLENGWSRSILTHQIESNLCQLENKAGRMGKGLHPCPSIQRVVVDGHVVPPLPILHGMVFLWFYHVPISKQADQPTMGIFLCKNKDRLVAEYALSDSQKPIDVSEYQLTQSLPENLQSKLPRIEEIENELGEL